MTGTFKVTGTMYGLPKVVRFDGPEDDIARALGPDFNIDKIEPYAHGAAQAVPLSAYPEKPGKRADIITSE
jgi:hypothetical protein